jgi:hypothetical protein
MKALNKSLSALFTPVRREDPAAARARKDAKALAATIGVELEPYRTDGRLVGISVWPPKGVDERSDPFEGDHEAQNWPDALERVERYAALLEAKPAASPAGPGMK